MPNPPLNKITKFDPASSRNAVTINFRRRDVDMYYVFGHELESLGAANTQTSLNLAFFGTSFGAALALGITLATVTMTSPFSFAAFWAAAILSTVIALYFGIRSGISLFSAKNQIKHIKEANSERGQMK